MNLKQRTRSTRLPDLWSEFDRFFPQFAQLSRAGAYPRLNLSSTDNDAFLTVEVPGLAESDLDLSVQGDLLTLRGVVGTANPEEGQSYLRRERAHGRFHRQIQLPYEIDADHIDAQLDSGILHIRLPRAESDRPRKIEVRCVQSERRS